MSPVKLLAVAVACAALGGTGVAKDEPKPAEKTHPFHMKDAKWDDVFAWYEKISERQADVRVKPKGSLTILAGEDRRFTLNEITDLINQLLMRQDLLLLPNQKTFAVVSTNKIDPKLIPTVELKDLDTYPRTAIVETVLPFESELPAEEVMDELKKFLTPLGEIVSVKDKSLRLRDTVENIRRIKKAIEPW